ncbi:MAG: UbiX family flavin prenyltransferase, partial [Anaerolineaceae bacterium]|nr:UbiX family flavin prenyltransferase [Anaerolineaceae bacterium]
MNTRRKRIILGITGASGAILGIRTLEIMRKSGLETHLIISSAAMQTIEEETNWSLEQVKALADEVYENENIAGRIASGSFVTEGMLINPCSIKTLSAVATSYADNLINRAADVCLKEGRPLLLAVRETPFHAGHLRLMQDVVQAGAIVFPVIPS